MAELDQQLLAMAVEELGRIDQILTKMSMWADDDVSDTRQRVSIALEDAATAVRSAGWLLERADPAEHVVRVSELVHRRLPGAG